MQSGHPFNTRSVTLATLRASAEKVGRALPLIPIAPALVVVFSVLVTASVGAVGIKELAARSDTRAIERASVVSLVLSKRLMSGDDSTRKELLANVARRSPVQLVWFDEAGSILSSTFPAGEVPNAAQIKELAQSRVGEPSWGTRRKFAVRSVGTPGDGADTPKQYIAAMVDAPRVPVEGAGLIRALAIFVSILVLVATFASHVVAREANQNIVYLTRRVRAMVRNPDLQGEPVPIRTLDEVGVLTDAFNGLIKRFNAAETRYETDLKKAEFSDRDRAQFIAAVSHELRSPLNAILGFADLLLQEIDGPLDEESRDDIDQIRSSGQHLLELINDILEFSALEAGQLKLIKQHVDVVALAAQVVREAEALVEGRDVALLLRGENVLPIEADPKRIRQILTNLVGNAVRYTAQGRITVDVGRRGSFASVSVSDTGTGISPQEKSVIFEDFKQAGDKRRRRAGTGLGLAIARRLVLMHGGSIEVDSELGKGSSFRVFLPLGQNKGDAS